MNKWDGRFLELAELVSTWSHDPSTKCGSVITKGKRIVSMGFNGFPAGCRDDCYDDRERKLLRVLHAEVNAILFAGRDLAGCTIYVHPFQPCASCMAMIIQSGITRVITRKAPDDKLARWKNNFEESQRLAEEAGIELVIV